MYLIIAKHEIELAGAWRTHGLVSLENGEIKPFLTNQPMVDLQVDVAHWANSRNHVYITIGRILE